MFKLQSVPSFCSSRKAPVIIAAKSLQDLRRSWGLNFHALQREAALTPWSSEPLCTQLEGRAVPGIRFLIQAWHFAVPRCPKRLRQHSIYDATGNTMRLSLCPALQLLPQALPCSLSSRTGSGLRALQGTVWPPKGTATLPASIQPRRRHGYFTLEKSSLNVVLVVTT